jgi:hypothetical protein
LTTCSVTEVHVMSLRVLHEVDDTDLQKANNQVPELDAIFYKALIPDLQVSRLADMIDHAPSRNVPEKMDRLHTKAKEQETEKQRVDVMAFKASKVAIALSKPRATEFSRSSGTPSSFIASELDEYDNLLTNVNMNFSEMSKGRRQLHSVSPAGNSRGDFTVYMISLVADVTETMQQCLSNAEKALVQASGTRAPIHCWGCKGLYEDCLHSFRNCNH